VREAEPELAVIALVTGLLGVIGSTVHGAYDVAVLAKPVGKGAADLPSQLDPRGSSPLRSPGSRSASSSGSC